MQDHKEELRLRYRFEEIGIFGSFLHGKQRQRSDVDILVEFTKENIPGLLKFIEMERHLGKLLKRRVDLVRKGGIRPELRERILNEVLYI